MDGIDVTVIITFILAQTISIWIKLSKLEERVKRLEKILNNCGGDG